MDYGRNKQSGNYIKCGYICVWGRGRRTKKCGTLLGGQGREDRRRKTDVKAVVKYGQDSKMCETERGTLHRINKDGSEHDMR